jgi:N-acetyl-gamma-glutamyl-phosphate reductase
MKFKVFVDGQEGTTGLQIFDRLAQRTDIALLAIDPDKRKDVAERRRLINAADIAFLCLPDSASRESVALVENPDTCIIDASTAFRIDPNWVYGLPELVPEQRERIRHSKRIANPGCHATGFVLAVQPLVCEGIMPAEYPVTCFSVTGYSGGGKKLIHTYETNPDSKLSSPRPYALGMNHKHLPEMQLHSGLIRMPVFTPVVSNFYKGMAVTISVYPEMLTKPLAPEALHDFYRRYYDGQLFVRVMPFGDDNNLDGGFLDVQGCNDTNRADLFVFGNQERICVIVRLDNLGKGASGAAVQSMNIHLGIDESTGLI